MMALPRMPGRQVVLVIATLYALASKAGGPYMPLRPIDLPDSVVVRGENQRLVGSGLALLLGPFAAHRIYLGTTPKVAVIYGLTFGGFGVLALADLGHLLFSKDLEQYRYNDRIIMWGKPREQITPR